VKYFIDTEFSERGHKHPVELISIGIVAEDDRELYLVNQDFKQRHANEWVRENVLPLLPDRKVSYYDSPRRRMESLAWRPYDEIGPRILDFVGSDADPGLWGYYCDYDYVLLSQLMGGMEGWPAGWPYYMHDLRQYLDHEGLHNVIQASGDPHDAMQDARWIRDTFIAHSRGWDAAA